MWVDSENGISLGHVRLSIIDISTAGNQPMISQDGRVVMVFNGEIYNYRELRDELKITGVEFSSNSDSEVLLSLFARYGVSCLSRLNGIFSVAFWERDISTLTLIRDPLGVKPLYISELGVGFAFASEMKVLLRSRIVEPRLNPRAVLSHLGYLWSPGTDTLVKGVSKILPGHVITVRGGKVVSDISYYDIKFHKNVNPLKGKDAATQLAGLVKQAVDRQMVSDVPVGAFLSGGLDSSAVVAFAQKNLQMHSNGSASKLPCFSIDINYSDNGNEGFSEDLPFARKVASHVGVDLHVVKVGSEMMDRLPEMIYLLDEPTPDPAALNTLFISELARSQGIQVLLSGAGGDDIFTGYRRHYALMQERWWSNWPVSVRQGLSYMTELFPTSYPLGRRINKAFKYAGLDPTHRMASYFLWMDPSQVIKLLHPEFLADLDEESLFAPLIKTLSNLPFDTDPLDKMLYLECKHFLADHNLNYNDKMGMAAGVEIRVPLLDLDLVDFAASLPVDFKQRGAVGKWIFKKAMESYLPHDVIYRPKTGFGVPLRKWLKGILKPLVDDVLSSNNLLSRGVFEPTAVKRMLDADRAGCVDASYTIFAIICIELWCRQYIDGKYSLDFDNNLI